MVTMSTILAVGGILVAYNSGTGHCLQLASEIRILAIATS